jgi:flagellar biosynthesis/type III secretory pathway M-ring protein FliF/YscJ
MLAARSAEGEVARVVLAQTTTDPGLGGWWVGIVIGLVVVLVVVAVVITLIVLARRITRQAGQASAALEEARRNTDPLWELRTTNERSRAILEGTVRAREALEDAR